MGSAFAKEGLKGIGEGLQAAGKDIGKGIGEGLQSHGERVGEGLQAAGKGIGKGIGEGLQEGLQGIAGAIFLYGTLAHVVGPLLHKVLLDHFSKKIEKKPQEDEDSQKSSKMESCR